MVVYSCCFAFAGDNVLLIRKAKPDWQKGLLNGIGGKLEDVDIPDGVAFAPFQPMVNCAKREFLEETGLVDCPTPIIYHSMLWPEYQSHDNWPLVYFSAINMAMGDMMEAVRNTAANDEPCTIRKVSKLAYNREELMPNLPFLIEMAQCLVMCGPEQRQLRQPVVLTMGAWEDIVSCGIADQGRTIDG